MNVGLKERLVTHKGHSSKVSARVDWVRPCRHQWALIQSKTPLTETGVMDLLQGFKDQNHLFRLEKVAAVAPEESAHFAGAFVSPG